MTQQPEPDRPPGLPRRRLLQGVAVAAGAAVLDWGAGGPAKAAGSGLPTLTRFRALVGQSFRCSSGGRVTTLVLRDATPLPDDPLLVGSGYRLLFTGPASPGVAGTPSSISSRTLPATTLFLAPVGRVTAVRQYEAVVDPRRPLRPVAVPRRTA